MGWVAVPPLAHCKDSHGNRERADGTPASFFEYLNVGLSNVLNIDEQIICSFTEQISESSVQSLQLRGIYDV